MTALEVGTPLKVLEHPERPVGRRRTGRGGREWVVYLTIALAAGVVTALGVPWWLTVPVALLLELACGLAMHRRPSGGHAPW